MFSIIGLILSIYGIVTTSDTELYNRSSGININLYMGIFMLVFGLIMLYFAGRKRRINKG
ncbi:MAG TPA: hypothetical protein VK213_01135 [Bacteroidales bacterium]|nr:hypothetical protein [Bacteroidales bacterium]